MFYPDDPDEKLGSTLADTAPIFSLVGVALILISLMFQSGILQAILGGAAGVAVLGYCSQARYETNKFALYLALFWLVVSVCSFASAIGYITKA